MRLLLTHEYIIKPRSLRRGHGLFAKTRWTAAWICLKFESRWSITSYITLPSPADSQCEPRFIHTWHVRNTRSGRKIPTGWERKICALLLLLSHINCLCCFIKFMMPACNLKLWRTNIHNLFLIFKFWRVQTFSHRNWPMFRTYLLLPSWGLIVACIS